MPDPQFAGAASLSYGEFAKRGNYRYSESVHRKEQFANVYVCEATGSIQYRPPIGHRNSMHIRMYALSLLW